MNTGEEKEEKKTSIKQLTTIKDGAIYTQLISLKVLQLGDCVFKTPVCVVDWICWFSKDYLTQGCQSVQRVCVCVCVCVFCVVGGEPAECHSQR